MVGGGVGSDPLQGSEALKTALETLHESRSIDAGGLCSHRLQQLHGQVPRKTGTKQGPEGDLQGLWVRRLFNFLTNILG